MDVAALLLVHLGSPNYHLHIAEILDAVVASTPERIKYLEIWHVGAVISIDYLFKHDKFPLDFLGGFAPRLRSVYSHDGIRRPHSGATWLTNLTRWECRNVHFEASEASWVLQLTTPQTIPRVGYAGCNGQGNPCLSLAQPRSFDNTPCTRATPVHIPHLQDITVFVGNTFGLSMVQFSITSWWITFGGWILHGKGEFWT